jgi:hypothetical protein
MPRDPLGAVGEAGVGGSGPGFGWARARRAGLNIFWRCLGEKGGRHYYISSDRVAALVAPQAVEDAREFSGDRELYIRIADEVCELARSAPYAYIWLPRDAPPLLHVKSSGELWLALEDWPRPNDVVRVGRLPYAGPEAACDIDYVLDVARRERAQHVYIRVVRKHAAMFHFQVKNYTVVVAESLR